MELRRDPFLDHWVAIADERKQRPNDFSDSGKAPECPFCPGNETMTPAEVAGYRPHGGGEGAWAVRVVPNKFPALREKSGPLRVPSDTGRLYRSLPPEGRQEVVIISPYHLAQSATLQVEHLANALAVAQHRMAQLLKEPQIAYVSLFENFGAAAGASREHPHWQLAALPMIPPHVGRKVANATAYYGQNGNCMFCDMLAHELKSGARVVLEDESFVCIAPYAARVPYELRIFPRAHRASFVEIDSAERRRFASHFREVLQRLRGRLDNPPLNWMLQTIPAVEVGSPIYHWHVEIVPRLTVQAGLEWGSGCYINPISPEEAATTLRDQ